MTTTVPPLTVTILRQGERLFVDLAEVGTLIPRGETRVEDTFLREVAEELRLLATPGLGETGASRDTPRASPMPTHLAGNRALERLGGLLFSHLFPEPVQARLRAAVPGDLYLRLDEQLLALPWELAYDGQAFLATKFSIGRQVITSQPLPEATQVPASVGPLKVLLIADPTESLPQAAAEVEQLCAMLEDVPGVEVTLLGGKNVRKLSLLAAVQEHAVVHFAGHSVYDPRAPGESGWRLHEGLLTARELGRLTHPPRVVFSNSCQAGATTSWVSSTQDGDQGFGLGSTFLLAGVPNYIGPCWVVDDVESVEFALVFYRHVAAGANLGAALRAARQVSQVEHQTATLTWASYVLYGNPAETLLATADARPLAVAESPAIAPVAAEIKTGTTEGQTSLPYPRWRQWGLVVGLLLALGLGGLAAVRSLIPSLFVPSQSSSPSSSASSLPLPDKPSIVVLPFSNMSGDPEQEYFSDGMTVNLITKLSKLSRLFVIARNSSFTYKGKAMKMQEIGQDLGVRYVLEGSVHKAENRVRITAQLVDAQRDAHLWAESYDRDLQDLFAVQDEITQQVVTKLEVKVMEAEVARVRRTPTHNLTAYDYFLRGDKYYDLLTKEAHAQARQMFEQAIALDPQYTEAYMMLGWSYYVGSLFQWGEGPQAMEQAFALAQKALSLNDSLALAHTLLGAIYLWRDHQHEQAIAEGERAITLDPNCGACYANYGQALSYAGRPQEAIDLIEKGMRLDPCCTEFLAYFLAEAYLYLERYEQAIAPARRALSFSPDSLSAHLVLAASYSALGQEEQARAAAAEVLRINPNFSLEVLRQMLPLKDRTVLERTIAAQRKAGLK